MCLRARRVQLLLGNIRKLLLPVARVCGCANCRWLSRRPRHRSSDPGAARRLTRRASYAMFCWHLASLAAGKTLHPTRWSLDGWRQRWAAPQRRTIFIRGASPRPGLRRARMSWRDRRAGISIINALVRRTRSRPTSRLKRSCWPVAVASAASLSIDPCGQTPNEERQWTEKDFKRDRRSQKGT